MITFIIPAYQAEETLPRTIDSIIRQTSNQWKVILVNDGSTDDTENICIEYKDRYPSKIRYLYQENGGPGKARNIAISLVETEYVNFLDSDDWLMPNYVETVIRFAKNKFPEMIMTLPVIYHEGSERVEDWFDKGLFEKLFSKDGEVISPEEEVSLYLSDGNMCRKILRLEFIRRINFTFSEGVKWEDLYPHFYSLSNCKSCMGIRSVGFYYRVGSCCQITSSRGRERLDIIKVFNDLLDYVMKVEKKELEFPVMRIFIRFSIWCIRLTDGKIRQDLIQELSSFYHKVPKSFYKELKKGVRERYCRADALQYTLFLVAVRKKTLRWIFQDYLYEALATSFIKKILGGEERVA